MSQPVILRFLGDTTDLESAFKRAAASSGVFEGVIKKMNDVGAASIRAGRSLTRAITIPVIAAGAGAVALAFKFDNAMNKIGALTDVGAKGVAGLSKQVLDLAKTVPIGPVKLAEGLYYLESAGLSSKVAMDALKASAKGSAAGLGDFAKLSDVVSGVLKGWPHIVGGATGAVDILIKTVKAGKLEPDALAQELGKVLAPAQAIGVQFKEVGAALAAMSNKNLNAEMSTTALRQIFVELEKPTKAASAAMKSVGTSQEEVLKTLREKGLLASLELLNKGVGKNSEMWQKLFPNVRASTGVMALMGANTKDTEAIFKQFNNTTGQLSEALALMSNDPLVRLKLAWNKIQVALIQVGNILVPTVVKMADKVGVLVDKFSGLNKTTQEGIIKFLGLAAAVGPALYGFGKLTKAFTTLAENPVLGFLILLGAALANAYATSKPFRDFVNGIGEKLKAWGLDTLIPKLKDFADGVRKVANSPEAARVLKDIGDDIKLISGPIQPVVDGIKALWGKFDKVDKVQAARDALKGIADVLENPAFQVALGAAAGAVAGWLAFSVAIKGAAAAMAVFDFFAGIADFEISPFLLLAVAIGALGVAAYVAYQKFKPMRSFFNEVGREAKILGGDLKWLWDRISDGAVAVFNFKTKSTKWFDDTWTSVKNGIKSVAVAIGGWLASAAKYVWDFKTKVNTWVDSAWESAKNAVKRFAAAIPGFLASALSAVLGWRAAVAQKLNELWESIKSKAKGAFAGAAGWLIQAGRDMIAGFVAGIGQSLGSVVNAATNIAQSAVAAVQSHLKINSPSKVMIPLGMGVGEGLAKGISDSTLGVTRAATEQMNKLHATVLSKQKTLVRAQAKIGNDKSLIRSEQDRLQSDLTKKHHTSGEIRGDKEAIARAKARVAGDLKSIAADKAAVAAAQRAYEAEVRYQKALNARRKAGAALLAQAQAMVADYSKKTATEFSSPLAKAADAMAKNLTKQFADRNGELPTAVNATVDSLKGMASDIDQAFQSVVQSLSGQTSLVSKFTETTTTGDMSAYLAGRVEDLREFNQDLRFLAVRGTPKTLLKDFISAGLGALPVVASLANSNDSDFRQILSLQSQVDQLTGAIAGTSEDITFGKGVSGSSGPYHRAPAPAPAAAATPAVVVNVATDADPVAIGQEVAWAVKGVG